MFPYFCEIGGAGSVAMLTTAFNSSSSTAATAATAATATAARAAATLAKGAVSGPNITRAIRWDGQKFWAEWLDGRTDKK